MRAAAQTFRVNPDLDVESVITELGVGEALVSFLDEKGTPGIVERAYVVPPRSKIGPIEPVRRTKIVNWSPVQGTYDQIVDRRSASEMLKEKAERLAAADAAVEQAKAEAKESERLAREEAKEAERLAREQARARGTQASRSTTRSRPRSQSSGNLLTDVALETAEEFGRTAGRSLVRGLLGTLSGKKGRW